MAKKRSSPSEARSAGNARLLVVEDERLVAMALRDQLEHLGYEVVDCVSTAEEAIEKSQSDRPDLVLMDVRLSGTLDGIDAAAAIRERFDIPSIFLTAYTDDETLQRAKLAEPLGYIVKPFDGRLLQVNIQVALYRHRMEAERAEMREGLRRSEERYRELSRIAPVGIFRADSQGGFLYVNEKWCSMTGMSAADAEGMGWMEAVHPEDRELALSEWKATVAQGTPFCLEHRFCRRDGTVSHVFSQSHPERSREGRVLGHIGTATDLTELRSTQNRLRESEFRLREIARTMPAALHQIRRQRDGTISLDYVSGAVESFTGMTVADVRSHGDELLELINTEDIEGFRDAVTQSESKMQPLECELRLRNRKTNEERWIRETANPVRVENGETVWNGLAIDITRGKKAEATLREAELARGRAEVRYAAVLDNSPDAIVSIDMTGRIVVFNQGAVEMFGYEREEAIGQSLDLLIPGQSVESHRRFLEQFRLGLVGDHPMVDRPEIRGHRKNGDTFPAEALVSKLEFEGETLLTAFVRDVSDRKKLEAQYLQSQKMDALGRLAGGVAHDFNNVLSVIMGQTELSKLNLSDNDPIRTDLDQVLTSCERAAALTRQLLIFSRQQLLEPRVVDVRKIVSDMKNMFRRIVPEDVELIVEPNRRQEPVLIDSGQLEQMIMNLIVNARDAMPKGGRISIKIDREETTQPLGSMRPGTHVVLDVTDTGLGMTNEVMDKIFEPFFTTKEVGQGTGLGLSTVFGIVARASGHVTAQSTPGKGSRFTVRLPLADSAPEPVADVRDQRLEKGSETILVVEDDHSLCRVITATLARGGYRALTAHDGAEAMLIVERQPTGIHLLLSDIILPNMDGVELAARLAERYGPFKTLFMSGYSGDVQQRRASEFAPLIQKPFTGSELTKKIRQVLDESPRSSEHADVISNHAQRH